MKTYIIPPFSWKTTTWSGGTTSELLILPEEANFKSNDYELRISIATVELEETTFTSLIDTYRVLTILEGELKLSHENHYDIGLRKYEQDFFMGDWTTKSVGKVKDFNVLSKNNFAKVEVLKITENELVKFKKNDFVFVAEGQLSVENTPISTNHSFICSEQFEIKANQSMVLIRVELKSNR